MKEIIINNQTVINEVAKLARVAYFELWSVLNGDLLADFYGEDRLCNAIDKVNRLVSAYCTIGLVCETHDDIASLPSGKCVAIPAGLYISADGENIHDDSPRYDFPVDEWRDEYNAEK